MEAHVIRWLLGHLRPRVTCTARTEAKGVELVLNEPSGQVLVVLLLGQRGPWASGADIQHPRVDNADAQKENVHPKGPVLRPQLVLQTKIFLAAPIVPINEGTGAVVQLNSLGLRHRTRHALSCYPHLSPPYPLAGFARFVGRGRGDEVATLAVDPRNGHHIHGAVCSNVAIRAVCPTPVISREGIVVIGYPPVAFLTTLTKPSPILRSSTAASTLAK